MKPSKKKHPAPSGNGANCDPNKEPQSPSTPSLNTSPPHEARPPIGIPTPGWETELAKEIESLHRWYRHEVAKRHAEAIVHEQCPSQGEDEVPHETAEMFQERMMMRVVDAEFVIYARYGKTHPLLPSTPPHLSPHPKLPPGPPRIPPPKLRPGPPRIPPPIPLPARKLNPLPLEKVTRKPRNDPGQSGATGVPSGRADSPG